MCVPSSGHSYLLFYPRVVLQFTIEDISSATENFSKDRVIGCGFGIVYKGLINGSYIAIKKLNDVRYNYIFFSSYCAVGARNEKQAGVVECGDATLHSCVLGYTKLGGK